MDNDSWRKETKRNRRGGGRRKPAAKRRIGARGPGGRHTPTLEPRGRDVGWLGSSQSKDIPEYRGSIEGLATKRSKKAGPHQNFKRRARAMKEGL